MANRRSREEQLKAMAELFRTQKTPAELENFLDDLLTPAELQALLERWEIVHELLAGLTQREVKERLKVSISKVSRGSRALQYGRGAFERTHRRLS